MSCGAIILYCLNLPPHLRYEPKNIFIVGLTPSPHMPDTTTISHLLDPVIIAVAKYGSSPGKQIPTCTNPAGAWVQAKIAPLIADLEASRKVSGFLSHAATMFCSFCLCIHEELENLSFSEPRDSAQVRSQAEAWLNEPVKARRAVMEKENGVRWTSLYRLPYWDPVKHIMLGYMHNWLEGVLQHHLRTLWGLGRGDQEAKRAKEMDNEELFTDTDVSDSADELVDLLEKAAEHDSEVAAVLQNTKSSSHGTSTPTHSSRHSFSEPSIASSSQTPTASVAHSNSDPADLIDDEDNMDLDYHPVEASAFAFTDPEIMAIRSCISNITLPTWVQRPPINLGESSHGKLKAQEYLLLFTCIFPLLLPEFWHKPTTTNDQQQHLSCFYHLVSATNIISSFKASNSAADSYTQHYIQYRAAIRTLFPDYGSKPNHHFAMHNGDLMKYWGPLPSISEFPGERMNGMLQGIKTNRRFSMSFSASI